MNIINFAHRLIYGKTPLWVTYPPHIQIDVSNTCNLSCSYCNVKQTGSFHLSRGSMTDTMFLYILHKIHDELPQIEGIHPFGNGEPLLDDKLLWRATQIKEVCNAVCHIATNGTLYKYRERLIHPNLTKVRFTISADTPETYTRVHGQNLFKDALKTLEYFNENRFESQETALHFIMVKENEHELLDWINRFTGFRRRVFPVHTHPTLQLNSEQTKTDTLKENLFIDQTNHQYYDIHPKNMMDPCQCWGIFAVSPFGEMMHCIDFPYTFNYGLVTEKPFLTAWKERLDTRLETPPCNHCSLRRKRYREIMKRWLKY